MSIYTTPLQFGYFFSLLLWILLLIRGYKNQRLSDKLLGWIMFILAMELQDYTFGFAGINFLWDELNGFPRSVSLLFGPIVYFYFLAQTNRSFFLKKKHLWHFLPYAAYFVYKLFFFLQGPERVETLHQSTLDLVMTYVLRICLIVSFVFYLSKCSSIYRKYRKWSLDQFSNLELIDFRWFRNFIFSMIVWLIFREVMLVIDVIFKLDFYQDWWWNLALAAVAIYIGLKGFSQKQPARISFDLDKVDDFTKHEASVLPEKTVSIKGVDPEKVQIAKKLKEIMENDSLYLQPELNLQELAQYLQTNPALLSAAINQVFGKNFNEYINGLRIDEFVRKYNADSNRRFTLLSHAMDSGFNSKATFNRAFKKIKGKSPQEFLNFQ